MHMKGNLDKVYLRAECHQASHSTEATVDTTKYERNNLHMRMAFETRKETKRLQNFLKDFSVGYPYIRLRGAVIFDN